VPVLRRTPGPHRRHSAQAPVPPDSAPVRSAADRSGGRRGAQNPGRATLWKASASASRSKRTIGMIHSRSRPRCAIRGRAAARWLERVVIEPLRAEQSLGQQREPRGALLVVEHRLLGGRCRGRSSALHRHSASRPARDLSPWMARFAKRRCPLEGARRPQVLPAVVPAAFAEPNLRIAPAQNTTICRSFA